MPRVRGYRKKLTLIYLLNSTKKHPKRILEVLEQRLVFQSLKKYKPYTRYAEHPFVEAIIDGTRVKHCSML